MNEEESDNEHNLHYRTETPENDLTRNLSEMEAEMTKPGKSLSKKATRRRQGAKISEVEVSLDVIGNK